jgi:N-acetylneuraminate epimerase
MKRILALFLALAAAFAAVASVPDLHWIPLPPLPDAEGFAGGYAGVSGGALLYAGGSNFPAGHRTWQGGTKQYYDGIFLLPDPHSYWRLVGHLPKPAGYGVSASFRGEWVIAGGGDLEGPYADVWALRWDGKEVRRRALPPLPRARAFIGGAAIGPMLYVCGGTESGQFVAVKAFRDLWALDLAHPSAGWKALPPLPGPGRIYPIAGTGDGDFYLFGGIALKADAAGKPVLTYLQDAYVYRPAAAAWTRLADLPHPEAGAPSPALTSPRGRPVILSGDDGTRVALNGPNHPGFPEKALVYDPADNRWSIIPDIPYTRSTAPVAPWKGMWVTIGGERKPGYRTPDVWGIGFDSNE